MGPKRRSTEVASISSSSLLHKVSRTPGRKGVRLRSQITDKTDCGECPGLLWEGEGMQVNHQQDGSRKAYGWGNMTLRENRPWHPQGACCPWWPASDPCQEIHCIPDMIKSGYFWRESHPSTRACLLHQKEIPHHRCNAREGQRGVWLSRRQILPLESTKRNGVYIQETRQQKIHNYTNTQTYWKKDTHTCRLCTNWDKNIRYGSQKSSHFW